MDGWYIVAAAEEAAAGSCRQVIRDVIWRQGACNASNCMTLAGRAAV